MTFVTNLSQFNSVSIAVGKKRVVRLKPPATKMPEIEISELSARFIFRRFDAVEDKY